MCAVGGVHRCVHGLPWQVIGCSRELCGVGGGGEGMLRGKQALAEGGGGEEANGVPGEEGEGGGAQRKAKHLGKARRPGRQPP